MKQRVHDLYPWDFTGLSSSHRPGFRPLIRSKPQSGRHPTTIILNPKRILRSTPDHGGATMLETHPDTFASDDVVLDR